MTGQERSKLRGVTEVFGDRADFVLANAYGITCDGRGFLNSSRVTFATGDVRLGTDGSLEGFDVSCGEVTIAGAGLDARGADAFDIVSAAATIDAAVVAQDLLVSAGRQSFDYAARSGTGTGVGGTGLAIDSSALGGMYANRIRLVGTEAGVGVNLQGVVAALDGDLKIDADAFEGNAAIVAAGIDEAGNLTATRNIAIDADRVELTDTVVAAGQTIGVDGGGVSIDAASRLSTGAVRMRGDELTNSGVIVARDAVSVEAGRVVNTEAGTMEAGAGIAILADDLNNFGRVASGEGIEVGANAVTISGELVTSGTATLEGASVDLREGGRIASGRTCPCRAAGTRGSPARTSPAAW